MDKKPKPSSSPVIISYELPNKFKDLFKALESAICEEEDLAFIHGLDAINPKYDTTGPQIMVSSFPPTKETKMPVTTKPKNQTLNPEQIAEAAAKLSDVLAPKLAKAMVDMAPTPVEEHKAEATLVVKTPEGAEQTSKELIGKPTIFSGPPCHVGVTAGYKLGLPNYSSAEVRVSVNIPCAHSELDQVFGFARDWVDAKMKLLTDGIEQAKKS